MKYAGIAHGPFPVSKGMGVLMVVEQGTGPELEPALPLFIRPVYCPA